MVQKIAIILILVLGVFLRFYKLGVVPNGLYQDETAIGYNAYSLLETGKDEHGQLFPLYFKSFGDYKLPAYIYLTALSVKAFGLNAFAVRLPSALFGSLTLVAVYFLTLQLLKNKNIALLTTLLVAINPWHLHYSRATFEVTIGLFLFVLGTLFLQPKLVTKSKWFFFGSLICFGFAIYVYNLTRILAPLLFYITYYPNRKILKFGRKTLFGLTVASILLLTPLLITMFSQGGYHSAQGTLINSSATVQSRVLELRSYYHQAAPEFLLKLFFNRYILTGWQYAINVVNYLSASFFFTQGSDHGNHGIGNVGQFYLVEIVFMLVGFVYLYRTRNNPVHFLFAWIISVIMVASSTREAPHATRSFFLIFPAEVLSAAGMYGLIIWFKNKKSILSRFFALLLVFISVYGIIFYFASYYLRFPRYYAKQWRTADKELGLFLKEEAPRYQKIIIDKSVGLVYSSILFYQAYPPADFQKTATWSPDDSEGFSEVLSFGKYEFRDIDWSEDYKKGDNLLVTLPDKVPAGFSVLRTINYPQRPVALNVKQEIFSYPVQERAYVILSSKDK